MSEHDHEFLERWEFRTNQNDLDSSSDDHSGPNFAKDPKPKKHKMVSNFLSREDNQETNDDPHAGPRSEAHLSSEDNNKEPNPSRKNLRSKGKGKTQKLKRVSSDHDPFGAALNDLRGYAGSLMEEIKVAREGLLDWMSKEMEKSNQNDMIPSKPNGKARAKSSKSARNNPTKSKRKSGTTNRKPDSGSSETIKGKTTSDHAYEQAIETPKEIEKVPAAITTPPASTEKKKRKRVGLFEKKQKMTVTDKQSNKAGASDQPNDKATAAATDQHNDKIAVAASSASVAPAPNYLTLPTVLSRPQVECSEKSPLTNGKERDFMERSKMNATISLSSQMTCSPRNQQKDGLFGQNGLRNVIVSDYEQSRGSKVGNGNENGNGNGFLFPFFHGLNGGFGLTNTNQFGLQFLNQENRMSGLRMNGGPNRLPSGNHAFLQNYGPLDQHLRFQVQGGVMDLQQCPDMRRPNFQPR